MIAFVSSLTIREGVGIGICSRTKRYLVIMCVCLGLEIKVYIKIKNISMLKNINKQPTPQQFEPPTVHV